MRLYTLHERRGRIEAICDGFDLSAFLLPPIWALWRGAWATFLVQVALIAGASLWGAPGLAVMGFGIALVLGFEGAAVRRAELRLRGWRRVGLAEARSAAGAEELWLTGEALAGDAP